MLINGGGTKPRQGLMRATIHGIRLAVIALCCYWATIFALTHLPAQNWMRVIGSHDKLIHAGSFAGLAFLLAWALPTNKNRYMDNVWQALVLIVTYAGIDELLQIPVGRTADWYDFAADVVGAMVGLFFYTVIRGYLIWTRIQLLQDPNETVTGNPL